MAAIPTIVLAIYAMGAGTTARNIVECVLSDAAAVAPDLAEALGTGQLGVAFTTRRSDGQEVVVLTGDLYAIALAVPAIEDSGVTDPPGLQAVRARIRAARRRRDAEAAA